MMIEFKDTLADLLFVLFIAAAVVHLYYYVFVYTRFATFKSENKNNDKQPVSVIVCAKNESKNLRKNIRMVLEQSYPDYEVIIVNDCSWDDTEEYLGELEGKYAHLKVVTLVEQEKYLHGKKFAVTLGIKAAKHELLLFTDADCTPSTKNWLTNMQRHFSNNTEIVLGYGGYSKEKGFLNKMIRFDTMMIAMQYISYAIKENAYMGVGRNLAYKKSLFFRNKGFAKHNHVWSGDDDLFVNENASKTNVKIEIEKDSFTMSEPKRTFGEWFKQKRRHAGSSVHYKLSHKVMLTINSVSNIFFFAMMITLLIINFDWRWIVGVYIVKLLIEFPVVYISSKKLNEKDLMLLFPVLELFNIILQPIFYISNTFTKQKAWK